MNDFSTGIYPMDEDAKFDQDALINFAEASRLFESNPSPHTIRHWCMRGSLAENGKMVFLQYKRIGGRLFTRRSWYETFVEELNEKD